VQFEPSQATPETTAADLYLFDQSPHSAACPRGCLLQLQLLLLLLLSHDDVFHQLRDGGIRGLG
jgi:hypothetical protein